MHGPTEPGRARRRLSLPGFRHLLLPGLLALVLAGFGATGGHAQQDDRRNSILQAEADRIEAQLEDPTISTPELDVLRDQLVAQRSSAAAAEKAAQPAVDELQKRLDALGPAPAEGATEAPEIAQTRADLERQIGTARAPVLEAQELAQRANGLIDRIDGMVRARFSAELLSRGPSPLRPATWLGAVEEIHLRIADWRHGLMTRVEDPVGRRTALRRLPVNLALILAGILITFSVRRWLGEWVDLRLAHVADHRAGLLTLALQNLTRLVVPIVGVGLIFTALDPEGLLAPRADVRHFTVPAFALVLIAAGWLSASLLSPRHSQFRLVPLNDADALAAGRLLLGLGAVAAFALFLAGLSESWDLSPGTQSAVLFPLILIGAAALWRAARFIGRAIRRAEPAPGDHAAAQGPTAGRRLLHLLVRGLQVVALAAPVLGALGYIPLAAFLVFRSALTLGLLGTCIVVYDLLKRTAGLFVRSPDGPGPASRDDEGLLPVVAATVVGFGSLAPLAMIWGARSSDIAEVWNWLQQGVSFGGIRLSAGGVLALILVFALGMAVTRLFQAVMRGSVLPRTRLDAGGRNAVLAGIGYVGFTVSALAAVSAAGLDLSNIAIVAGALSVGIGFGLQNVVSNFVSGIILLVERPVKEGDWIEVGGFSGYVKGINVRSTEIQTFDRASVILPNSDLVAGTVLNRTHTGMSGRLQVPVGVGYGSDPRQVEAVLLAIAEAHPLVLEDPAPVVLFMAFGASSLDFEIRCWLRDVNFSLSARSDMNFEIIERFRAEGIEIPFPQQDLHIKGFGEVASALDHDAVRKAAEAAAPDVPPAGDGEVPRAI